MFDKFGDTDTVICAYNAGETKVRDWMENGKVVITKRVLTITGSLSSEYGNDVVIDLSKCQISNSVNDIEDLLLTATTTADSSSSIGRYDVVVSCGNSNYILSQHVIYKIEPKHITIKADYQEFEYGEEIVLDLYKYTIEESYNQDEITVSLSLNESLIGSFVGTFPNAIVVNCVSSDNYVVGTLKGSIKIIPRNIEVSINDYETDVIYGDEIDSEKFSYNVTNGSVVNGDNLNLNLLTNASSTSNVGKYNIVGKNNNSNYNVSFVKAGLINIVKRPLMINVKMHSIYGEFINLKDFTYTIVSGRIANDDELNIVLETTATQNSSVGLYNLTIVNCNNNYIITLDDLSFYTIEQRPITITSVQHSEYGNNHVIDSNNYYVSAGRILEGDNLNIKLNLLISSTASIGEYKINVEHSNNNYTINSNAKLVITARKLKIKIDDVETVYGNNVSLNNSKYEILQGSVVAGDNLNIELSSKATSKSNVGNYAITGKAKNKNYSVEFINGNLKINKCKVIINLLDQSVKHGNYIDLDQTAFTIVKGEVENKEDLKIRIYANATSYSNVGSYEIFAESSNNNYEISYNNATLTIKNSVLDYCFIIGCASVSALTLAGIVVLIVKKVKNKRLYNEIINRLK